MKYYSVKDLKDELAQKTDYPSAKDYSVSVQIGRKSVGVESVKVEDDLSSVTIVGSLKKHSIHEKQMFDKEGEPLYVLDKIMFVGGDSLLHKGTIKSFAIADRGCWEVDLEIYDHSVKTFLLKAEQMIKY